MGRLFPVSIIGFEEELYMDQIGQKHDLSVRRKSRRYPRNGQGITLFAQQPLVFLIQEWHPNLIEYWQETASQHEASLSALRHRIKIPVHMQQSWCYLIGFLAPILWTAVSVLVVNTLRYSVYWYLPGTRAKQCRLVYTCIFYGTSMT